MNYRGPSNVIITVNYWNTSSVYGGRDKGKKADLRLESWNKRTSES